MAEELAKKLAKKAEQLKQQKPKEKTPAEIEAEKERERKLEEERKLEAEEKRRKAEEKAEEKHRKAEEKQKAQEEAHQKERSVFVKANEIITNTNEKVVKIETLLNEHNQLEKRYSFKGFEEAQAELKQQLEEEQAQLKQVEEGQKRIEEKLAQIPIQLPKLQTDPLGDPQFQAKILTDLEHYNQRIEKALEQTLSKAEFEQFRHDIEQLLASQKEEKPTTIEDYQFKILRSYIINFHSGRNKPKNTWRASRINNVAQDVSIDIGYFKGIWDDLCQKQWVKQLKEIPEYMIDEEKGEGEAPQGKTGGRRK